MKSVIVTGLVIFLTSLAASAEVVKRCETTISFEGKTIENAIVIESDGRSMFATIEQRDRGMTITLDYDVVKYSENSIREGLSADSLMAEDNNKGESLVAHAMMISSFGMSAGFDLSQVRRTKVWELVEEGVNIGSTAIVEAFDGDGNLLGSFLGGFLISGCK